MPSVALAAIKDTGALDDGTAATLKEEIAKFKRDLWKPDAAPAEPAKVASPGQTTAPAAPANEEGAEQTVAPAAPATGADDSEAPASESGKTPVH
jgi:hypothetical protein